MGITHRCGKPELARIMCDLGAVSTLKEANQAYDAMTMALNAWLRAMTRSFPKSIHQKLNLRDAFTINLAWIDRSHRNAPKAPAVWINVNDPIRANIRRHRLRAYAEWAQANDIPRRK